MPQPNGNRRPRGWAGPRVGGASGIRWWAGGPPWAGTARGLGSAPEVLCGASHSGRPGTRKRSPLPCVSPGRSGWDAGRAGSCRSRRRRRRARGTMRLGCGAFAAGCVVIEVLGVALFLRGFFPAPARPEPEPPAAPAAPEPLAGTARPARALGSRPPGAQGATAEDDARGPAPPDRRRPLAPSRRPPGGPPSRSSPPAAPAGERPRSAQVRPAGPPSVRTVAGSCPSAARRALGAPAPLQGPPGRGRGPGLAPRPAAGGSSLGPGRLRDVGDPPPPTPTPREGTVLGPAPAGLAA